MSNKNPNIIVHYYIESIRKYGVYPRRVRADMGTENVHVETIQKFLRRNHGDEHASEKSFFVRKEHTQPKNLKLVGNDPPSEDSVLDEFFSKNLLKMVSMTENI